MNRLFGICLLLILLYSCQSLYYNLIDVDEKAADIKGFNFKNKHVVFISMHHVGTKSFYDDVKNKISYYTQNNYDIIYEGVQEFNGNYPASERENYIWKFRKITGLSYKNTPSNDIFTKLKSDRPNIQYIKQPSNSKLGIDTLSRKNHPEFTADKLIDLYEKRYGAVILDDCDQNTPIESKYNCSVISKKNIKNLLLNIRNEAIAKQIMENSNKNILVIFGKAHYTEVKQILDSIQKNK